jgi:hypothetical protein
MSETRFIEYFIRRVATLPRMGEDVEFVAMNEEAAELLDIPRVLANMFIRGIPIALMPLEGKPFLVIKRKDTGAHEEWLEDYELDPDPPWDLMCFLNRLREMRRPHISTRLGEDGRLHTIPPGANTGGRLP